ncbi:Lipid-A-disaccharide synthase [Methylophaga frappieri]|uniref:Lipid-A-disaccharide synthase n=1 Tax=Methylophaga frappieri (strain ATCC BAA-2434 / DSM 25690 / JAM7) TaxID=754477 RepID=I1YKX7_METFJ|nr:lipid-A-disaccharide synthase [Methylophaga frappieri]AFJ03570.1 Lipid-A-disaccharide synthase [Methylophaga frappieri]
MSENGQIFIVAGEASGEAHAARLITALKRRAPHLYIGGIGGEAMRAAGADIVQDFDELAVMGLFEVLKSYSRIKSIFNETVSRLKRERPDLLILVDYPGFNLKLAKQAKKLNIPVLYYISPKVWAWRPRRIKQIKKTVDHMAVLFPFEEPIYQQAGVPVTCVGHPLVDAVSTEMTSDAAKLKFNLVPQHRVIGLFPGSRRSEIEALLPIMLAAAERIQQRHFDVSVVLPLAPGIPFDYVKTFIEQTRLPVQVVQGDFYDLIKACDAIVAASGTVTLEIALLGTPHLLVYKVSPWTYRILKRLVKIPHVGLCNIMTNKPLVTELLQEDVNAVRLDQLLTDLLTHPHSKQRAEKVQQQVRSALGPTGGADNAAQLVLKMMQRKND